MSTAHEDWLTAVSCFEGKLFARVGMKRQANVRKVVTRDRDAKRRGCHNAQGALGTTTQKEDLGDSSSMESLPRSVSCIKNAASINGAAFKLDEERTVL